MCDTNFSCVSCKTKNLVSEGSTKFWGFLPCSPPLHIAAKWECQRWIERQRLTIFHITWNPLSKYNYFKKLKMSKHKSIQIPYTTLFLSNFGSKKICKTLGQHCGQRKHFRMALIFL